MGESLRVDPAGSLRVDPAGVVRLADGSVWWRRPNGPDGRFDWAVAEPPLLMDEGVEGSGAGGLARSSAFRDGLLADLRPVGRMQSLVAERIVLLFWRSLRGADPVARSRRMVVRWWEDAECTRCYERCEFDAVEVDRAVLAMAPVDVARYDASVSRQLRRDLDLLGAMQGRVIGAMVAPRRARPAGAGSSRSKSKPRP